MVGYEVLSSGIKKFADTDFGYWRMQIEEYLYGKKLHLPLLRIRLEKMNEAKWNLLDRQVLGVSRLILSTPVAHNIIKERNTANLMATYQMTEGVSVAQHLNDFNIITNQLSFFEIDFENEIRALILLASLPNSWEAVRMAVNSSVGKSKLKYDDIRDLILIKNVCRKDSGATLGSSSTLNVDFRGRSQDRNSNI